MIPTILVSPDGMWVVVTERDANRLEVFPINPNGRLGEPVVSASSGAVPVSSDASLTLINGIAVNTVASTTPIDIDLTVGDGYLYTLEARSGKVTGFSVGAGATLTSVGSATAGSGSNGLQGIAAW